MIILKEKMSDKFEFYFLVILCIKYIILESCNRLFKYMVLTVFMQIVNFKLCSHGGNIKSFIELKKIFRENFINVKEDIDRRCLSWRNQGCYTEPKPYSRF